TDRYSLGAVGFGSNVSTWVGPPPSQSQTTAVFRVGPPAPAAFDRAWSSVGRVRPVAPRAPILRKSRRVRPSQSGWRRALVSRSMGSVLGERNVEAGGGRPDGRNPVGTAARERRP